MVAGDGIAGGLLSPRVGTGARCRGYRFVLGRAWETSGLRNRGVPAPMGAAVLSLRPAASWLGTAPLAAGTAWLSPSCRCCHEQLRSSHPWHEALTGKVSPLMLLCDS